jgi:hypothetical protein
MMLRELHLHVNTLSTLCSRDRLEPCENYFAGELRPGFTLVRHMLYASINPYPANVEYRVSSYSIPI